MIQNLRFAFVLVLMVGIAAACSSTASDSADSETAAASGQQKSEWISLFDGETLDGWHRHENLPGDQVGGKWEVVDGAITGDQDPPGHGGFLVTEKEFEDYVLEMETKLDYPVDSGVFLRVGETGKSHQVTLDWRPDGQIGAIYLPWTQGGVHENPSGREHFNKGEWNDLRIRIEGEPAHIQAWVNGTKITDFQHTEETTEGVPESGGIALQVHPGDSYEAGNKVRFRDIRLKPLN